MGGDDGATAAAGIRCTSGSLHLMSGTLSSSHEVVEEVTGEFPETVAGGTLAAEEAERGDGGARD